MQVGNMRYLKGEDLPKEVRLFPLAGAFLLPSNLMPLNVFEPRYLKLFDDALTSDRIVGLIQPSFGASFGASSGARTGESDKSPVSDLCHVGTLGRITSIAESGDGRYLISLGGICRFRLKSEKLVKTPYRVANITPFIADLEEVGPDVPEIKMELLQHLHNYVEDNDIEVDYDDINQLKIIDLVNLLSGIVPFDVAEKQALLEADFDVRVQTLIALLEMGFDRDTLDTRQTVQ